MNNSSTYEIPVLMTASLFSYEPYMMLIRQHKTIKTNESLIRAIGQLQQTMSRILALSFFKVGKQDVSTCTTRNASNMIG